MPGKVKVRVLAGRNLPVMDRSSDTTDAYVEVKLCNTTYKTDVFRKSLNPQWNSEWFIFEVDDLELQDEPLQIRLMDHDTYSANDAIGKVYVDLNPLLLAPAQPLQTRTSQELPNPAGSGVMSGWLPVYDTMHGIRGEVNILVKVDLFSDFNKFRQSSCGVQFFFTPEIPAGFRCNSIIGFVEEIVANDDPEYQWIDKIRTPRASNEARQTLFSKLSGELQRRIGLKVLDQGGNAVIGYHQCFDLEGESGIAVRGIGSVVSLTRILHDGTAVATTHSPSPLREFGMSEGMVNQRETLYDDFTLESLYVSLPNSSHLMPVSLVQLPKTFTSCVPSEEAIFIYPSKRSNSVGHKAARASKEGRKESEGNNQVIKKGGNLPRACYSRSTSMTGISTSPLVTTTPHTRKLLDISPVEASKKKSRVAFQQEQSRPLEETKRNTRGSLKFKFNSFLTANEKSEIKKTPREEKTTGEKGKGKVLSVGRPISSQRKFKIPHVWPKCMKMKNGQPAFAKNIHLVREKDISFITELSELNPFGIESVNNRASRQFQRDKLDGEVTNIETFYSGIRYSNSDPTLNQSTSMKDFMENIYQKNRPLQVVSDDVVENFESDSELNYTKRQSEVDQMHHKFYLSENDSSSSSSKSIDTKTTEEDLVCEASLTFSAMDETKGDDVATVLPKPNTPVADAFTVAFASSALSPLHFTQKTESNGSRRGSFVKGAHLHSCPGSLPDIRVVPCSPTPSSSKSMTFCEKFENSLRNDQSTHFSFKPKHLPLPSNSSSTFSSPSASAGGLTENKGLSLSSSMCSRSSNSSLNSHCCKNSMSLSDGRNPSSNSRALGVLPSHSLLCVVPAECCLSPPIPSLPHSSYLPLHVSSHSLVDLTATTTAELSSRSGLSPSTVSPKRGSRSRKTSASYSISRSPQLHDGVGETAATVGASQSPTHSVKIASPSHTPGGFFNRRSSDSDLSITPKGGSLTGSGGSSAGKVGGQGVHGPSGSGNKPLMSQESFDNLIYPFLTMKRFPPNFIIHLGGTVSARSVKLLDRGHLPEEMDSRDSWWAQLRTEIRSHARSIACNVVLGYEEFTTICDEVCVLNATGTAAVINVSHQEIDNIQGLSSKVLKDPLSVSLEKKDLDAVTSKGPSKDPQQQQNSVCRSHPNVIEDIGEGGGGTMTGVMKLPTQLHSTTRPLPPACAICHIPYMENANPFNVKILKCAVCRKGKVPDVLLTTLELPATIPITGRGCLIQARVVRSKKDLKGELNAKEISDSLPFLEYELHKQLYQKIMIKGMNSLFGLRVRVTVGEKWVVGLGTGTAVYLSALPPPPMPRVVISGAGVEVEKRRAEKQKKIQEVFEKNREMFGLRFNESQVENTRPLSDSKSSDTEDSEEELLDFDLSSGNKDAYILDLDDLEDVEMLNVLLEGCPPPHLMSVSTQTPPGFPLEQTVSNLQMFTRVWRGKVPSSPSRTVFSSYFEGLLQSIYFKVRNLSPCVLSGLKVDVELPEADEIQISILGMVLGQGQPPFTKSSSCGSQAAVISKGQQEVDTKKVKSEDSGDLMFAMEEVGKEAEEKSSSSSSVQPLKAASFVTHSCNVIASALHRSTSSTQSFPSVPSVASISSGSSSGRSSFKMRTGERQTVNYHLPPKGNHFGVEITPLSFIPGARIERYLGNLNFFFIRESTSIKENGGLGGFMGSFITEVLALVRAHVAAVGGNAMISYFLSQCVLLHNPHKNQGQCLINVGGDIVQVAYSNANTSQEQTEINQQINSNAAEPVNCINSLISE